jgi:hypothetical protein
MPGIIIWLVFALFIGANLVGWELREYKKKNNLTIKEK